jgi:hypothetical protein
MSKKTKLTLLSCFLILLLGTLFLSLRDEPRVLSKKVEKTLSQQLDEIGGVINSDITTGSSSFLISPIEDSKDEFTTFYTYYTLSYLEQSPNEKVCRRYAQEIKDKGFIEETEETFTGIERLYNGIRLLELCEEIRSEEIIRGATDNIKTLWKVTYDKEGYFLSDEFKDFQDKAGYLEVKLNQTYMMLDLASKANITIDERKMDIKNWLDNVIKDKTDPLIIRKYLDITELLGFTNDNGIISKVKYDSFIGKEIYNFNDLVTIENIAYLHDSEYIQLSEDEISTIINTLALLNYQFTDIQTEYYVVSIYSHLDELDSYNYKDELLNQFNSFVYTDGMLPLFSKVTNPFSSLYTMVTALDNKENNDIAIAQLRERVSMILQQSKVEEILEIDSYELYSYIKLQQFINPNFNQTELAKQLIKAIKEELSPVLNAGNIIKNSHYIHSLSTLNATVSKEELPRNIDEALNKLGNGQVKLFKNSNDFTNLLLVYSLSGLDLFREELQEVIPYVKKVDVDLSSDVAAYELYYKALFLNQLGEKFDQNEVARKVIELQKGNGYKLNKKQRFANFYSTSFLIELSEKFIGER